MHFWAAPTAPPLAYSDSSLNHISLEYSYAELQQATRNFDASMKLGSGSYGGVYRGVLTDGTEVAIKVLDVPDEAGFEEEVKVLSKFRHPHLVILMGFARHGVQRLLVYELLAGGDLHRRLQRSCQEAAPFPWRERVSIALDAACGLSHLHHAKPKVFHRDIKSPNILLDKNGTGKMADFGLACLSHASAHRVKQASGTVGYACPLYVQRGVVTEGSEVYSFGMVLLELLTASPPAYVAQPAGGGSSQVQYLAHHINGDVRVAMSLADSRAGWQPAAARAIAELALGCTAMQEERRPGFTEIVRTLRAIHDGSGLVGSAGPPVPLRAPGANHPSAHVACAGGLVRPALTPPVPPPALAPGQAAPPGALLQSPGGPVLLPAPAFAAGPMPAGACGPGQLSAPRPNRPRAPPERPQSPPRQMGLAIAPQPPHASQPPHPPQPLQPRVVPVLAKGRSAPAAAAELDRTRFAPAPAPHAPQSRPQQKPGGPCKTSPATPPATPPAPRGSPEGAAAASPVLFSLECTFSEAADLRDAPPERHRVVHRSALEGGSGRPSLTPLTVGRAFQKGLLDGLVAQDAARSISREHFQIWAEEASRRPPGRGGDRIACTFFLANLSCNGTHLNDEHLQVQGEQTVLHQGDIIALSRPAQGAGGTYHSKFIQFRFDLSDSCLREAEWAESDASPRSEEGTWTSSEGEHQQDSTQSRPSQYCEGDLVFVLEVCGPGVREQVPLERKRIAYAPPPEADKGGLQLYSSLVIGRAHQLNFWQEVLHDEAFTALSRQHLEVQTWRGTSASRFSFLVQNLSDVNPLHVRSGPKETADAPASLSKGEQRHLLDGDEIVLNLNHNHTFWLIFRDLTESTSIGLHSPPRDDRHQAGLCEVGPRAGLPGVAMTTPLSTVIVGSPRRRSGQESLLTQSVEQPVRSHAPVLRPPFPYLPADEDEISTAATPYDLRQEEEEDNDGDVGAGYLVRCTSLKGPFGTCSAESLPHGELESDGCSTLLGLRGPMGSSAVRSPPGSVARSRSPSDHCHSTGALLLVGANGRAGSPLKCEQPSIGPTTSLGVHGRTSSPPHRERDARGVRAVREAAKPAAAVARERDVRGVSAAVCPRVVPPRAYLDVRRDARGVREDHGLGIPAHSAV